MAKKAPKAKEPVRIRLKKLANGNQSIYLDIYTGGRRQYEFLKLYLIPESTPFDKEQNKQTLQAANAIKSQRVIELANNEAGIKNLNRGKMKLGDWLNYYYTTLDKLSESAKTLARRALDLITEYGGDQMKIGDVDKDFCKGFIHYVSTEYVKADGQPLSSRSVKTYCDRLNFALNKAVKDGILVTNPFKQLDRTERVQGAKSKREYLTIDEVKKMIATDCTTNKNIKTAFLFSCFCGLRLSDIKRLRWGDIKDDGGKRQVVIYQQKTKELLYLPLSGEALKWLPDRGRAKDTDNVFKVTSPSNVEVAVKKWAAAAGIQKHVTFHTARHTFATMMLTVGTDLYTTSKLLGHTNIVTTQIYAEIIDKKKVEAVNLVNGIFND